MGERPRKFDGKHVTLPKSKAKHFISLFEFIKSKTTKRERYTKYGISQGAMEAVERGNVTARTGELILAAYNDIKKPSQ